MRVRGIIFIILQKKIPLFRNIKRMPVERYTEAEASLPTIL